MRTLIVGGGLGGMALAAFLKQRGLDFQLFERSPDFSDQGFALGLWSNGRAIMNRLGLAAAFDALGTPITRYQIVNHRGSTLRTFSLDHFSARYGSGYVQVSRQALQALLRECTKPASLRMGTRVAGLRCADNAVVVDWVGPASTGQERFDLVIGADGVRSTVRQLAMPNQHERYTGWRSWYAWLDRSHVPPAAMVEYLGPSRCAALFDDRIANRALGVFFAAQPPGEPEESLPQLTDRFAATPLALQNALTTSHDFRLGADLATVHLQSWSRGRIALLGDAAHAFEPHNGLGASMAMEDALVLADQLALAAAGTMSIESALSAYEAKRRPRIALAQRISDRIRRFAFTRRASTRALADLAVPLLPRALIERDYFRLFDRQP